MKVNSDDAPGESLNLMALTGIFQLLQSSELASCCTPATALRRRVTSGSILHVCYSKLSLP